MSISLFQDTLAFATTLSLEKSPVSKFQVVLSAYKMLKEEFHSSDYLPLSAFFITNMAETYDYDRIIRKAKDLYVKMKREHPFLTSGEDCGFAFMIAISNSTPEAAISEMEKCYSILKEKFHSGNALQSLSHTLTLGEENETKCNKVIEIFNLLKENNCKYGTGMELLSWVCLQW